MLNQDCARDILLFIDDHTTFRSDGVPNSFKFKAFCEDPQMSEKYTISDMNIAIVYLCQKGYLESVDFTGKTKHIHIQRITAHGYDYLQIIKSPKIWNALQSKFGKAFETATSVIIEAFINGLFKI